MPKQFWIKREPSNLGPFTGKQIRRLFSDGTLSLEDEISEDGQKWRTLSSILEHEKRVKAETEPKPAKAATPPKSKAPKPAVRRDAATRPKPPRPKPAPPEHDDLDVIEDFEEVDDEIEDYGEVEDYGDEFGGYGEFDLPAAPRASVKTKKRSRKRTGGSWGGAYAGLTVFHYSFITLAIVAVAVTCSMLAIVPAAIAGLMIHLEILSRDSAETAFYLGDFVLLLVTGAFVMVISSVRGEVSWWGILAGVCAIGAGICANPFLSRSLWDTVTSILGQTLICSGLIAVVACLAILVGWLMSFAVPSESGLRKFVGAGFTCLFLPGILVAYAKFGGVRSPSILLLLLLLQIVAAVGVFVTFSMYLRGIGRHFKDRRLVDSVDGYVATCLIAVGASVVFFLILFALPREIAGTVRPLFLIGFLFVGPYLSILLVDTVAQAREAVRV